MVEKCPECSGEVRFVPSNTFVISGPFGFGPASLPSNEIWDCVDCKTRIVTDSKTGKVKRVRRNGKWEYMK